MKNVGCLLTNARTTEVGAVTNQLIGAHNNANLSTDAYLTGLFSGLVTRNLDLTTAINRGNAESDLETKDLERDNCIRAVYNVVTGHTYNKDAVIKPAAVKVESAFERYGMEIINKSYASESTLINSLLQDFSTPELKAAIAIIPGVTGLVEYLQTAQAEFEAAQLKYQEEKSKSGNQQSASTIKKEVVSIINEKLVAHLNAMVNIDEAKYGAFAGTVAQIIDDMNVAVKKRNKSDDKSNDTGENKADVNTK